MTLHSRSRGKELDGERLSVSPLYARDGEIVDIPKHRMPDGPMMPEMAYQIIHDELMLDGNARLNLATFVTTWMEPQAGILMDECRDKNMIDKDEYPQTAELKMRCVNILSRLWNSLDTESATGCSTTGSSEAAMLGGLALKRRWQHRRRSEARVRSARTWSWVSTSRSAGRSSATTGMSSPATSRWKESVST